MIKNKSNGNEEITIGKMESCSDIEVQDLENYDQL